MKTLFLAVAALSLAAPAAQAQMSHGSGHGGMKHAAAATAEKIPGTGAVNAVDPAKRTVNLTHEPIAALGWPTMTMDFAVAEGIDLGGLKKGDKIAFTLSRGADGIYMIDGITDR